MAQAEPDPLEAEAGEFYESQLEGMTAERFAEVIASIDSTEGRYGKTTYGLRISQLRERATAKVAEAGAREEEARRQAAFEEAVAAADDAGPAGDLEEAVRQLKLALEAHDDEAVRGRLADLEGRMKLDRLLTEAATHEKVGEWERAKARYEEALEVADDESREAIQEKLAEVEKRIETEKAVAAIRREADAGNWREARSLVQGARASGIADVRLADLSRRVAKGLAPPATLTGPLAMELVLVSGGTFSMGSDTGKRTERPVHEVTLDAFYVSRFEVTRAQFDAFRRGQREVAAAASRLPAAGVSWQDAGAFSPASTSGGRSTACRPRPSGRGRREARKVEHIPGATTHPARGTPTSPAGRTDTRGRPPSGAIPTARRPWVSSTSPGTSPSGAPTGTGVILPNRWRTRAARRAARPASSEAARSRSTGRVYEAPHAAAGRRGTPVTSSASASCAS